MKIEKRNLIVEESESVNKLWKSKCVGSVGRVARMRTRAGKQMFDGS